MKLQMSFLRTCRPKKYQNEPTTWTMRKPIIKFAQADTNTIWIGEVPNSRGKNLNNLGINCAQITIRRRLLAYLVPEDPKEFATIFNIIICKYFTTYY